MKSFAQSILFILLSPFLLIMAVGLILANLCGIKILPPE